MKNVLSLLIVITSLSFTATAQIKAKGFVVGASMGRPYLSDYKNESPSNSSQVFLGYRFVYKGSIYAFTPRLSVQRSLITTSKYFEQVGSDYHFTEAPITYQNNRLMTYVATLGLGISIHRKLDEQFDLEVMAEPQIGKNIVNRQLYYKDGETQTRSVSNNPLVYGGEITVWLKKKCHCDHTLMLGPGVLFQNGGYVRDDNFRSITPLLSLAMVM